MDNILNEIGKLRHEMSIGFIEIDNRFDVVNDNFELVMKAFNETRKSINETREQVKKVATLMDNGFGLLLDLLKEMQKNHEERLKNIEDRLNKAGL